MLRQTYPTNTGLAEIWTHNPKVYNGVLQPLHHQSALPFQWWKKTVDVKMMIKSIIQNE